MGIYSLFLSKFLLILTKPDFLKSLSFNSLVFDFKMLLFVGVIDFKLLDYLLFEFSFKIILDFLSFWFLLFNLGVMLISDGVDNPLEFTMSISLCIEFLFFNSLTFKLEVLLNLDRAVVLGVSNCDCFFEFNFCLSF